MSDDCPYCAPDEKCGIHVLAPLARVVGTMPDVIVLPSESTPPLDFGDEADSFVWDLMNATGALVICVPEGKLEALTREQAREALQAIADREAEGV